MEVSIIASKTVGRMYMAVSEKIELLGKGLYANIPDELTLTSIPTSSELEYVGSEDFEQTMLDVILPQAVKEDINFRDLLEIDFHWVCRGLRLLNYGPYHTTNSILCSKCGETSYGEYLVDLRTVAVKPLPEGFDNDIIISKDEFIDFGEDVHIKLPTIQDMMNAEKDKAFSFEGSKHDDRLARICYSITSIGARDNLNPVEIKMRLQNDMSSADYMILRDSVVELSNYGLRVAGTAQCPNCHSQDATFIVLMDDRFFRPSLGALRQWRDDRRKGEAENVSRGSAGSVRVDNR